MLNDLTKKEEKKQKIIMDATGFGVFQRCAHPYYLTLSPYDSLWMIVSQKLNNPQGGDHVGARNAQLHAILDNINWINSSMQLANPFNFVKLHPCQPCLLLEIRTSIDERLKMKLVMDGY